MSDSLVAVLDEKGIMEGGSQLLFFVETGSEEAPTVSMRDNPHWPPVKDMYIFETVHNEMKGVQIKIRFDEPLSSPGAVSVNINQSNISIAGSPTVVPLA
ncbi:hypothetical protein JNUCC31_03685 [Paenibacillus sp. JNUCC31]|uniref:hypothetical protein n=1 Tax=Paenibacillus sp. JNUCC-31 TaxID=2777983 RepID=UPI00177C66E4|nr:hypothetical protein [Paenibacillus sp. JNUCC-31]QOS80059.1 hypothetical protein JNUCC31_03685 [Paenibacillus sp. JNUCC-31]